MAIAVESYAQTQCYIKHQSQKDSPCFPGDDARKFWVRAEDRNRETTRCYDELGFAE